MMHPSILQGIHHQTSMRDTNLEDASVMIDDSQTVKSSLRMYTHERSNTTAATSYLSANLLGDHEFL